MAAKDNKEDRKGSEDVSSADPQDKAEDLAEAVEKKKDAAEREPIRATPIPPAPEGQAVQVALGMQLIQQSSFDRLEPEIQGQLIDLARSMDDHAFENAQDSLRGHQEIQKNRIEDGAVGRKQLYIVLGGLAFVGLLAGTSITLVLILQGEHQLGHTVMMSGLAVVSALLGGAGLSSLIRRESRND